VTGDTVPGHVAVLLSFTLASSGLWGQIAVNSSKLNDRLQVAANIGIVLGLVLVGIQLKQNSDLVKIQLLYEESNRAIELETKVVGEHAADVWAKSLEDPENLTLGEIRIMEALLWSFVEQLRGTHKLAELGLISDSDWRARVDSEVTFYLSDRYSLAWWDNFGQPGGSLPQDLIDAINATIAGDKVSTIDYITTAQRTMKPRQSTTD